MFHKPASKKVVLARARTLRELVSPWVGLQLFVFMVACSTTYAASQDGFTYEVSGGRITITGYTGPNGAITIPATIAGQPVTTIGENAFRSFTGLTSVTIPNSVTTIGDFAFAVCVGLTSVTIPSSVSSIGGNAFLGCTGLTAITVDPLNPNYSSQDGVLFDQNQSLLITYPIGKTGSYGVPNSVTTIGTYAFYTCAGLTAVTIPNSVTSIGYAAFASCTGLTSVTIGDSVITIGDGAFASCTGLTSVTIPNSVANIESYAFGRCTGLTSVTVPSSVTSIGNYAFVTCTRLTAITVDPLNPNYSNLDGVLFNKNQSDLLAYPGGKVGSYIVPNSVTTVRSGAFEGCAALTTVTIPNSVATIGEAAFARCTGLTSVTIGNSVTSIGSGAFGSCTQLTAITVDPLNPDYSSLDGVLFNKNQSELLAYPAGRVGSYVAPNGITTIAAGGFAFCTALPSVTLPNGVRTIGDVAFYGCAGLTSVYFAGDAPTFGTDIFTDANNATVYYQTGTLGWDSTFAERPTVLWDPQARTSDPNFGVRAGQFGFNITGASGLIIVVEATADLIVPDWSSVATITLTAGSALFTDPDFANHPTRFYRFRSP